MSDGYRDYEYIAKNGERRVLRVYYDGRPQEDRPVKNAYSRPCAECGLPALIIPFSTHRLSGGGPICATCAAKTEPENG